MGSLETGNGSETNIMINAKPAGGVNRSKLIQGSGIIAPLERANMRLVLL